MWLVIKSCELGEGSTLNSLFLELWRRSLPGSETCSFPLRAYITIRIILLHLHRKKNHKTRFLLTKFLSAQDLFHFYSKSKTKPNTPTYALGPRALKSAAARELGPPLRQPHWTIRIASDHSSCEHMADSIQTCPATNYTHKFSPEILSSMELFS